MTIQFPPFLPLSEGLMSALASRSHEWTEWEIRELSSDSETWIQLKVLRRDGSFVEKTLSPEESPSFHIQEVFSESVHLTRHPVDAHANTRFSWRSKNSHGVFTEKRSKLEE